jgi:hypothetical protein
MKWSIGGAIFALVVSSVSALGQGVTISFQESPTSLQLSGGGDILLDGNEWWGVIRAADDLAADFGKVSGTNLLVQIDNVNDKTGVYEYYAPTNHREYIVDKPSFIKAPEFKTGGGSQNTVIIAGTIGKSRLIDDLVNSGKIDATSIRGQWEAFTTQIVDHPIPGVTRALVIAGSDKRGTIFGLYDLSEQIGVSPFYWWADVPPAKHSQVYALSTVKVQGSPSIKYRGLFINDEAPALTNWVDENYEPSPYGVGFNSRFYSRVFELILRLRGNYLWPAMWGSMFNVDDDQTQPLADAFGIVMGTSHTEPLLRAKDEWPRYGDGIWQWDINDENIRPFFKFGVERAKPYEGIYNLA